LQGVARKERQNDRADILVSDDRVGDRFKCLFGVLVVRHPDYVLPKPRIALFLALFALILGCLGDVVRDAAETVVRIDAIDMNVGIDPFQTQLVELVLAERTAVTSGIECHLPTSLATSLPQIRPPELITLISEETRCVRTNARSIRCKPSSSRQPRFYLLSRP
jgi:hypothetical protein